MRLIKKLNLQRFKKNLAGIREFANLIEQTDAAQREKILQQAEEQDAEFVFKVMKKVVFFEELIYMDESVIAEILSQTSPKVLAYAINGMPKEFRDVMLKQIGFRESRMVKDEEERMGGQAADQSLVLGAQKAIIKLGRALEKQEKISFELSNCPRFKKRRTYKTEETPLPTEDAVASDKK